MNIFFVFDDGSMSTPPLGGTILPGVTRSSLITLAKDKGIAVREERYSIDQWKTDAASGRLREAFACGTAAVVTPIGTVRAPDGEFRIGNGGSGTRTEELKSALVDIQRGRARRPARLDPQGFLARLEELAAVRHDLVGAISTTLPSAAGKPSVRTSRHELADLARREVHHGRDLAADQASGV